MKNKTLYTFKKITEPNFKILSILLLSVLVGCSSENSTKSLSSSLNDDQTTTNPSSLRKVFVEEALIEDIQIAKVDCKPSSDNSPKVCIKICHIPPGNPQKKSEKILPLSAIKAHLHHGHHEPESSEGRDYLGSCQSEEGNNNSESPADNPGSSSDDDGTTMPSTENPTDSSSTPADTTNSGNSSEPPPSGSDPSSTDSEAEADTSTDTSIIPLWCQPFVDSDSNCDGITDSSGEPYL